MKSKLRYILILLLGFGYYNGNSQNLIANGSFENYSNIDCVYGGFDNYTMMGTPHIVNNWYTLNSSDYFNSVCTNTYTGVPANLFGNNHTKQGNAYIGIISFLKGGETKEYAYQQLITPLQAGKIYCLSFYVSRADGITHAIKNIGAYFSPSIPPLISSLYINAIPQVVNQSGFITDTTSWTEIQGCFTATGTEQYITIGNFNSNANTDTLYVGSNNTISGGNGYAYYYIDDVTLVDQTTVSINELTKENSFEVYPNPNNGMMQLSYSIIEKAEFILTDITGRIINSYTLDESQKSIDIKEQELKAGIYFYTVKQSNRILKQDKIVIIK